MIGDCTVLYRYVFPQTGALLDWRLFCSVMHYLFFFDRGNRIELDIVLCIPSQRKLDWRLHCFVSLLFYRGGGFPGREAENQCGGHPSPPPPGGDLRQRHCEQRPLPSFAAGLHGGGGTGLVSPAVHTLYVAMELFFIFRIRI